MARIEESGGSRRSPVIVNRSDTIQSVAARTGRTPADIAREYQQLRPGTVVSGGYRPPKPAQYGTTLPYSYTPGVAVNPALAPVQPAGPPMPASMQYTLTPDVQAALDRYRATYNPLREYGSQMYPGTAKYPADPYYTVQSAIKQAYALRQNPPSMIMLTDQQINTYGNFAQFVRYMKTLGYEYAGDGAFTLSGARAPTAPQAGGGGGGGGGYPGKAAFNRGKGQGGGGGGGYVQPPAPNYVPVGQTGATGFAGPARQYGAGTSQTGRQYYNPNAIGAINWRV